MGRRKETSLAALLVERGFMTTEQEKLVNQLMELSLRKHGGDTTVSLAVLFSANSKSALAQVADPVVQQSVAFLSATDGAVGTTTVDYEPRGRERYTLTRLYAKGGIGQAFRHPRSPRLSNTYVPRETSRLKAAPPPAWFIFKWAAGRPSSLVDAAAPLAALVPGQGGGSNRVCVGHWLDAEPQTHISSTLSLE